MSDRRQRLRSARLYLVCQALPTAVLRACLRGGVDAVQLRMKDAPDDRILAAASLFRSVCVEHRALFILNDRPDLAVEAEADGVHLGQDDMPVSRARALIGESRLIGLSTHSPAQVDAATGCDYLGVGPVHATPTKPGRPAVGLGLVRYAAARAPVPFFAIGGIHLANVAAVRAAGAPRVAVVRALAESADPQGTARALREAVKAGEPVGTT